MDTYFEEDGSPLPLPSLRLVVPPLRLMSAALWQVVQRRDVMNYGLLEEFAVTVLDIVPDLMTSRERVQLFIGLRARLVLELCRCDHLVSPETIQPHMARISSCIFTLGDNEVSEPEVEASVAGFHVLIETLLEDPQESKLYFQNVFPKEFGPEYDSSLQTLVWKFLSRLEKLIPIPDFKQTALWLRPAPAGLEECVQAVSHPEPLKTLIQYHKNGQKGLSSAGDDYILSALSPLSLKRHRDANGRLAFATSHPSTAEVRSAERQPGTRCDSVTDDGLETTVTDGSSGAEEVDDPDEEVVTRDMVPVKKPVKKSHAAPCPKSRRGGKPGCVTGTPGPRQLRVLLLRLEVGGVSGRLDAEDAGANTGDDPQRRDRDRSPKAAKTMHPSILKTGGMLEITTYQGSHWLGCPLCPKFNTTRGKTIWKHLDAHIKLAVHFQDAVVCRCNLSCRDTGHYHCPYCEKTIMRKEDMTSHVTGCQKTCDVAPPPCEPSSSALPPSGSPSAETSPSGPTFTPGASLEISEHPSTHTLPKPPSEPPLVLSALEDSPSVVSGDHSYILAPSAPVVSVELPSSRVTHIKTVKCPHCPVVLYKKNLSVHIQRKHRPKDSAAASHRKSVRVDAGGFDISKGFGVSVVEQWADGLTAPCQPNSVAVERPVTSTEPSLI